MGKIIQFPGKRKECPPDRRVLTISHEQGKISTLTGQTYGPPYDHPEPSFEERMARIKAALARINQLMEGLKK